MEAISPMSEFANSVDDVLITSELVMRPSRPPDYEAQSHAMLDLAEELRTNPGGVLHKVAELAMKLCHAGSAGISILEPSDERDLFRWHAIAGSLSPNIFGTLPRSASPCGTAIARNRVLLFNEPDRFYPDLRGVSPHIYESLLAPWSTDGGPAGTLWVVAHTPDLRFDAEDARILQILAKFASGAYQMVLSLQEAQASQVELEKRIEESAHLLADAFKILRAEMAGRAQADRRRKQAESALLESEKQTTAGRLSSLIADQINNPLEAVSNLLYMAEYATSIPEAREHLARAQTELARVGRTATAAFRLDRRGVGAAPADLGEIVEFALALYADRISQAGIGIQRRYKPQRRLLCFSGEIRQVMINLIGNALVAMKGASAPRLLLRISPARDWERSIAGVRLTVADSGVGMASAVEKRIFEPFFTAWETPGVGLGLWVSQVIVSKHKGVLKVRSAPRKGAVFTVFLPYLQPSWFYSA